MTAATATATTIATSSCRFIAASLYLVRAALAQQAGRLNHQHHDQDREGYGVLPGGGDERRRQHFRLAHNQRANESAGDNADATKDRRNERLQARDYPHEGLNLWVGDGIKDSTRGG